MVVTGSASGIGAATRALVEKTGDRVTGIDIKDAEIIADLSTREGREAAIAAVTERCEDALDVFVACAGLATYVRPPSLIASVNYFGAVELLDGLFGMLRRGSDPSAVLILSNSAQWMSMDKEPYVQALLEHNEAEAGRIVDGATDVGMAASGAYVGSKLALGKALRRRAMEWGQAGVRLNGVAPGNTDTPMLQRVLDDPYTSDTVRGMKIPLLRWAEPDDIARMVVFLCSPEVSYIHGGIYYVDGEIDRYIRPDRF